MKNWTQLKLAKRARIDPKRLSKIIRNDIINPNIDTLIAISLALQLSPDETTELLTRAARALSPALAQHREYKKLVNHYSALDLQNCSDNDILDIANDILTATSPEFKTFPAPIGNYISNSLSKSEFLEHISNCIK